MRQVRPEPVRSNAITDARRSAGIRRASDGRFRLVEPLGASLRPVTRWNGAKLAARNR